MNENQHNGPTDGEERAREEVKRDFQGLVGSTRKFLSDLLDIRRNTDQEATKEAIIADIPFKGHTSWILICSIFIASVGLNANSTAVVIGAMLISPLMGPILGIGMSIAINDIDTLRRSLKNFTVMVVLSVVTAFLFFWIFPLRENTSELLARTQPDFRDVLIAFFGGLALVIARAKKGTIASVIFGVAIATALMPPLCTVGFGLAKAALGNVEGWSFAGGAMYLFIINTIFIALATFLVLKLLRFPMVRYANSQRRRYIARLASIVAILVMVPAGYTFFRVYNESLYKKQVQDFIDNNVATYQFMDTGRFIDDFTEVAYNDGENPYVELVFMGNEQVPDNIVAMWKSKLGEYSMLGQCDLRIVQGGRNEELDQLKYVNELYENQKAMLLGKDERIELLEEELEKLREYAASQIPFREISAEARANYEHLEALGYASTVTTDFNKLDTVPVFEVKWKKEVSPQQRQADMQKLGNWLKVRLKDTTLVLRESE
ncbi:MAG: DUF389 domain-containing protein [Flavobacteriaceae bacterium]